MCASADREASRNSPSGWARRQRTAHDAIPASPRQRGQGGMMLKIERLTKTFGKLVAVDNVSFEVPSGQMVGIIGRSGAGKSTLLRMINRLTEPTDGKVHYQGRD